MKKLTIILLLCCLSGSIYAQISTDERPLSFDNQIIADVLQEQRTDVRVMPRLDMKQIQEEDEKDEQQGAPPRFGFPQSIC